MSITFESDVTWRRSSNHWGYPVRGTAKNFINVHTGDGPVFAANVLVTADTGLYRRGDVITVPVAELSLFASVGEK